MRLALHIGIELASLNHIKVLVFLALRDENGASPHAMRAHLVPHKLSLLRTELRKQPVRDERALYSRRRAGTTGPTWRIGRVAVGRVAVCREVGERAVQTRAPELEERASARCLV